MGIPVVGGRAFNDADRADGMYVSMVNRAFERKYWPGGSALGKRLKRGPYGGTLRPWTEIVGIVDDVRGKELGKEPNPMLFYPQAQNDGAYLSVMVYTVRAAVEPSSLVPLLRQAVAEVSPIATVFRASVGADILRQGTSRARFNSLVMLVFSLVGLILAVTGIYGVTAFSVGRRTREFGLRMALGAQPREVRRLVLRGATSVAGWGLVFGTLLSLLGTRLISELFYGVPDFDVATYSIVSVVLCAVVMIAAYVPARRATRIHPATALRGE
ncbi:MAG: FtsX-like permease family protein [Gemmatimonadetes bacterium]|nr:FtsX-like permease family protein [Gemmatimonadota bacterium]